MSATTRATAQLSGSLYYADCPRCHQRIGLPFNRMGGPQVSEHHCGKAFWPRRTRYIIAASGVGYMAYAFSEKERVEATFAAWVSYWTVHIQPGILTLPC